jgi:hypothetical protein
MKEFKEIPRSLLIPGHIYVGVVGTNEVMYLHNPDQDTLRYHINSKSFGYVMNPNSKHGVKFRYPTTEETDLFMNYLINDPNMVSVVKQFGILDQYKEAPLYPIF